MRRRLALAAFAALAAAGCGFQLRRPTALPFKTIALAGFAPRSPLAEELRRAMNATATTIVVESPAGAQAVLRSIADAREKSVVASTAAGQVREVQLRTRLEFELRTPGGRQLIAPTQIVLSRDISYSESAALGKEQEESLLYRAMQNDIVAQVMRRLAAVQNV
jgi:LPS-assembly lipoprotein